MCCVWLLSLNIRFVRVILCVAIVYSFLLLCYILLYDHITIYLSIVLLVDFGLFSSLGYYENAAKNISGLISSVEDILMSGNPRTQGMHVFKFKK